MPFYGIFAKYAERHTHTDCVMNILSSVLKYLTEMVDGISTKWYTTNGWKMALLYIQVCTYYM